MKEFFTKIILSILLAVIYGLLAKYMNFETAILTILIMIYVELKIRGLNE
jgi:hypothetical protein